MSTLSDAMKKNPVAYFSGTSAPIEKDHSEIILQKFLEECQRRGDLLPAPPRGQYRPEVRVTLASYVHKKQEKALIEELAKWSKTCRVDSELQLVQDPGTTADVFESEIESSNKWSDFRKILVALDRLKFVETKAKRASIGSVSDPIVDDDSFIQLVASGNIPVKPDVEVAAARAFLCAKCVYQSYLYSQYRDRLFKISEDIENERAAIDAKNQAYRESKVEVSNKVTPLLRILIEKQTVLQSAINNIKEGFRTMVDDTSRLKTPFTLWSYLKKQRKPKDGSTILKYGGKDEHKQIYETSDRGGTAAVRLSNLTDKYEQLVLSENNLLFDDETIEKAKYDICWGAKNMIDAGVDDQVRYKFYRMATSFAIAPSTMFGSMAMNIALMGPPGTGKSTLAKKMGEFAHAVGWLTSNKVVEPKPSDLISAVRGQTAVMTRTLLNSALGQMLFIDEAYALTPPGDAAGKEFSDELTEFLTNHRGMIMVLVAGYVREMNDEFFTSNIGLPRRFPTRIILGEKTPMACFNAFMRAMTEKLGKHPIGAINIAQFRLTQMPFFLVQASIWIPVFNILLGKRFKLEDGTFKPIHDDPVNLLSSYYADIGLIAEIYCRYLMSEGLFHKTTNLGKFGDGKGAVDPQKPFDMAAIVTNVLNDWVSTKNGNNTVIENVALIGQKDGQSSTIIKMEDIDIGACGLTVFEEFLQDPVDNAEAAIFKAKSLLENRVCLWPVSLNSGKVGLICPNVKVAIAFKPKSLTSPGKIPFSNSFSWYDSPDGIQMALSAGGSSANASALVDHAADLRKQQVTAKIIDQYNHEQQQQMERIKKIADKIETISGQKLPAVSNSPEALEAEILRLNAIIDKMMSEHQPQKEKDDIIAALKAREFALEKRNKELERGGGRLKKAAKLVMNANRLRTKRRNAARFKNAVSKVIEANKTKGDRFRKVVKDAVQDQEQKYAEDDLNEIFEPCKYNDLDDDGAWGYIAGDYDNISKQDFINKMEKKAKCLMKMFALNKSDPDYEQKIKNIFDAADTDRDGRMDKNEFKEYVKQIPKKKIKSRRAKMKKELLPLGLQKKHTLKF